MQQPLSLRRRDYIESICSLTNKSGLPAFVIVEALERVLEQAKELAASELKRDEAAYRAAQMAAKDGSDDDGRQENK